VVQIPTKWKNTVKLELANPPLKKKKTVSKAPKRKAVTRKTRAVTRSMSDSPMAARTSSTTAVDETSDSLTLNNSVAEDDGDVVITQVRIPPKLWENKAAVARIRAALR